MFWGWLLMKMIKTMMKIVNGFSYPNAWSNGFVVPACL